VDYEYGDLKEVIIDVPFMIYLLKIVIRNWVLKSKIEEGLVDRFQPDEPIWPL